MFAKGELFQVSIFYWPDLFAWEFLFVQKLEVDNTKPNIVTEINQ